MVECKLAKLSTDFTPERISLHIDLVPVNGVLFDLPLDEAGKKFSAVCNYAVSTFAVRAQPLPVKPPGPGGPDPAERQRAQMEAGAERALAVLGKELKRAEASKDPKQIAQAKVALARAKEHIERNMGHG